MRRSHSRTRAAQVRSVPTSHCAVAGLGVASLALAALVTPHVATAAPVAPHPYFDDHGTLPWYEDLCTAQREARAASKAIFIEYGRRECGNCRALVTSLLPSPTVARRIGAAFVGLASDADQPDPCVEALFACHLPGANVLPFVALVTPDLRWIAGWYGATDLSGLSDAVRSAESELARSAATPPPTVTPPAPLAPPPPPAAAATPDVPPPLPNPPPAVPSDPTDLWPAGPLAPPRLGTAICAVVSAPATTDAALRTDAPPCTAVPAEPSAILAAAREAKAAGRYGDVVRLGDRVAALPADSRTEEAARLAREARRWASDTLDAAAVDASNGRLAEAAARMNEVVRAMDGLPAADRARTGLAALARKREIEGGSFATPTDRDLAMRTEALEYAGTRWATLFSR